MFGANSACCGSRIVHSDSWAGADVSKSFGAIVWYHITLPLALALVGPLAGSARLASTIHDGAVGSKFQTLLAGFKGLNGSSRDWTPFGPPSMNKSLPPSQKTSGT